MRSAACIMTSSFFFHYCRENYCFGIIASSPRIGRCTGCFLMCGQILHAMMSCTGVLHWCLALVSCQCCTGALPTDMTCWCLMSAVFACNGRELCCASSATLSPCICVCIMPAANSAIHDCCMQDMMSFRAADSAQIAQCAQALSH